MIDIVSWDAVRALLDGRYLARCVIPCLASMCTCRLYKVPLGRGVDDGSLALWLDGFFVDCGVVIVASLPALAFDRWCCLHLRSLASMALGSR